jgi:thiamine kinase-like enzyme
MSVVAPAAIAESAAGLWWIEAVLRDACVDEAADLVGVSAQPVGTDVGCFGQVMRLELTYLGRPAAARSLILKLPSRVPANRAQARSFGLYTREAHFYRDVAPTLKVRVPACIGTLCDERTGDAALLLEDLSTLSRASQLDGVDPIRAEVALSRLAAAHTQWWESDRLTQLDWLEPLGRWTHDRLLQTCRAQWSSFVQMYRDCIPRAGVHLGARFVDGLEGTLAQLTSAPTTLLHGDFRADNLFFDDSSAEQPVAIIDWQLCGRGRGAFDVAYLLCQSMRVEDRRRHEMSILRTWHQGLVLDGVNGYSLEDAVDDYRRGAQLCLAYAVLGSALERTGRAAADARVQVERSMAAALDLATS